MRAKPVIQKRAREKRDQILQALDELLKQKSFADISVNEIAQKAKVSPATLYQRFSNVDATASVLMELYYRRVEEWAVRRSRKKSAKPADKLIDALTEVANQAWEQIEALKHIMRPAYLYSRLRPELVGEDWSRLEQLSVSGFKNLLKHYEEEVAIKDHDRAAAFVCYAVNFLFLGQLLHEAENLSSMRRRKAFVRESARMLYAYLTLGK